MCGIFAVVTHQSHQPNKEGCMQALDSLSHRGPDGFGLSHQVINNQAVILGHRRLSITGVLNGSQPFETSNTLSVVNGEFYGWNRIKNQLIAQNHKFKTQTDSEILPMLFERSIRTKKHSTNQYRNKDPMDWLHPLVGEWCFALVDKTDNSIWIGCDPFGTKPLRWWRSPDNQTTIVASEAKAIFTLGKSMFDGGIARTLDYNSLGAALSVQYLPWGKTLFKDIGMLPPGCWMHFVPGKPVEVGLIWNTIEQNYSDKSIPLLETDEFVIANKALKSKIKSDQANAIRVFVENAVQRRLPEEREVCTHLSGGIDSAIVTALAVQKTGKRINGYCASFPWAGEGDETSAAQQSAQAIGAKLTPVIIGERDLLQAFDQASFYSEGLSINPHAGAKILVAKQIRSDGYRVTMTGEGADEAFLGYEHFRTDLPVDQQFSNPDANPLSAGIMQSSSQTADGLDELQNLLSGNIPSWINTKVLAAQTYNHFLIPKTLNSYKIKNLVADLPTQIKSSLKNASSINQARSLWSMYAMSGYILRGLDDAMGMSQGVESRLSFLDPAVQWLAKQIDPVDHWDQNSKIEKGLLRLAMKDLLPENILSRPKRAFLTPSVFKSFVGEQWAQERLLEGRLSKSGLFEKCNLQNLLSQPVKPVRDAAILTLASLSNLMESFDV